MYLELAQRYLDKARSATGNSRAYFVNLCKVCLAKQGATPEEIGTSSHELAELINKANEGKSHAETKDKKPKKTSKTDPEEICKKYLKQCREAFGTSRQYFANLCLSTLAKHNLAPEAIESTDEELQELQRKGFLESASNYLKQARTTIGTKRKCYADLCWEYLSKGKGKPVDIGTSEEELLLMSK